MDSDSGGWHKTLVRRAGPPAVLFLTGCAMLIAWGDDSVSAIAGFFLVGVAGVIAVSLVFYEVGLSEDRERAREAAGRSSAGAPPAPDAESPALRAERPDPHRTARPPEAGTPRRPVRPPRRRSRGDDR